LLVVQAHVLLWPGRGRLLIGTPCNRSQYGDAVTR
jgi:hypothetical protein